jgi:CRP/FNR family cyclic AMP-dependent transcriptional regulator
MQTESEQSRIRQQLAGHPFVQGLEPHYVEVFVALGHIAEFESRDIIFRSGQPADTFYLVRSGVVALQVEAAGAFPRTISHLTEGSALGWSWLFEPHEWQFDAVAQTPVRTIAFDAAALRAEFVKDPTCGYHVMARVAEVMARRLHATRHQLLHQSH